MYQSTIDNLIINSPLNGIATAEQSERKNKAIMKTLASDTTPAAERVLIHLWREMPAWRKMELVGEMNATVKTLARAGLAQRFPNALPQEIERRLADILLGAELAQRVYGAPVYPAHAP